MSYWSSSSAHHSKRYHVSKTPVQYESDTSHLSSTMQIACLVVEASQYATSYFKRLLALQVVAPVTSLVAPVNSSLTCSRTITCITVQTSLPVQACRSENIENNRLALGRLALPGRLAKGVVKGAVRSLVQLLENILLSVLSFNSWKLNAPSNPIDCASNDLTCSVKSHRLCFLQLTLCTPTNLLPDAPLFYVLRQIYYPCSTICTRQSVTWYSIIVTNLLPDAASNSVHSVWLCCIWPYVLQTNWP